MKKILLALNPTYLFGLIKRISDMTNHIALIIYQSAVDEIILPCHCLPLPFCGPRRKSD